MKVLAILGCFLFSFSVSAQTSSANSDQALDRAKLIYKLDSSQESQMKDIMMTKQKALEEIKTQNLNKQQAYERKVEIDEEHHQAMLALLNPDQEKIYYFNQSVSGRNTINTKRPDPKTVKPTGKINF